ncbi:MAG: MerR family transcriptional regulator, partial [Erythrobacteraceae bacterium]
MTRLKPTDLIPIGEIARRTGLSVSAIRFYEEQGLIEPVRSGGNQRRFLRSDIRRLSFILIAQKLGLALGEIKAQLATLPQGRTPNARDWEALSRAIRETLDARIAEL